MMKNLVESGFSLIERCQTMSIIFYSERDLSSFLASAYFGQVVSSLQAFHHDSAETKSKKCFSDLELLQKNINSIFLLITS
jgi:hypothetical protein